MNAFTFWLLTVVAPWLALFGGAAAFATTRGAWGSDFDADGRSLDEAAGAGPGESRGGSLDDHIDAAFGRESESPVAVVGEPPVHREDEPHVDGAGILAALGISIVGYGFASLMFGAAYVAVTSGIADWDSPLRLGTDVQWRKDDTAPGFAIMGVLLLLAYSTLAAWAWPRGDARRPVTFAWLRRLLSIGLLAVGLSGIPLSLSSYSFGTITVDVVDSDEIVTGDARGDLTLSTADGDSVDAPIEIVEANGGSVPTTYTCVRHRVPLFDTLIGSCNPADGSPGKVGR
ncbi:MAG: hypothetical protein Q7T55_16870 [Solirubrobacteraceae bacterium]|nr:hypothetical protein [Solirubrobacteraceae bacterium]